MIKKVILLAFITLSFAQDGISKRYKANEKKFSYRVIVSDLKDPWEISFGPDDFLWITEAKGYTVSRINIRDGKRHQILDLNSERKFADQPWPQGGLMGMALHPALLTGKPFVYLAYIYRFTEKKSGFGGNFYKTKLVRYTWNPQKQQLTEPEVVCDTIPGSNDHNGGRLIVAPVDGDDYVFYSVGDMGAGQFENGDRTNKAQQIHSLEGKILRFNTEPVAGATAGMRWIPKTNPFKNAVWSFGHRNPQGLASGIVNATSMLYSSEHGPYGDDEVNLIEKACNYGHPLVIGYTDGNYNGLAASVSNQAELAGKWKSSYPFIKNEFENASKLGKAYRNPLISFNPNDNRFLNKLFNATLKGLSKPDWPSDAPSSLALYTSEGIPGWRNSLLIPTLKSGKLIRLQLNAIGTKIQGEPEIYFKSENRYRDIAISPDGRKIYLITDRSSITSGPTKEDPQASSLKGAILEFTYQP